MMRDFKEYQIWDSITPKAVTSSTDATPIVVTATTHGFVTGDVVMIFGHTTNVAANGLFKITRLTANTFSLQDYVTGADIAGSGAGAGSSGVAVPAPKIVLCQDFTNAEIQVDSGGTSTWTAKIAGSLGLPASSVTNLKETPNFGATISKTNPYSFLDAVNLANNADVPGATGIVTSGTDIDNMYEVNINAVKYLTLIVTAWTAGTISAKVIVYNNK